jgi:hypothetical protein
VAHAPFAARSSGGYAELGENEVKFNNIGEVASSSVLQVGASRAVNPAGRERVCVVQSDLPVIANNEWCCRLERVERIVAVIDSSEGSSVRVTYGREWALSMGYSEFC